MKVSMIKCNDFACTNFKAIKYTDTPPGAYARDISQIEYYNRQITHPDKSIAEIINKVPLIKDLSKKTDVYVFSQHACTDKKSGGFFQAAFVDPKAPKKEADMITLYDLDCKTEKDWLNKLTQSLKKLPSKYSEVKKHLHKSSYNGTKFIFYSPEMNKLK